MHSEKNLKLAQHHWWPRTLSMLCADSGGYMRRLSPDDGVVRSRLENFGTVKNAHHIKLGEPEFSSAWDETFEPKFEAPDSVTWSLVCWLESLTNPLLFEPLPLEQRIAPAVATDE